MPNRDLKSQLDVLYTDVFAIGSDGTITGNWIDTADFGEGFVFGLVCTVFNSGVHSFTFEDSADGSTDPQAILEDKIIGDEYPIVCDSGNVPGEQLHAVGFFGTRRFIRAVVASTGVTGLNQFQGIGIGKTELQP